MKPGPLIAMIVILGLSVWIMFATSPSVPATPGAAQLELVVANHKLKVEQRPDPNAPGQYEYRFRNWPDQGTDWKNESQYQSILYKTADTKGRSWLLQIWNVTSYGNLIWVAVGLGGQLLFSGRMLVQWFASEKNRRSVVPPAFWYLSLGGGLCLTAYFLWRHDLVALLGQSMGLVVYVRNIRLLLLHKAGPIANAAAAPAST